MESAKLFRLNPRNSAGAFVLQLPFMRGMLKSEQPEFARSGELVVRLSAGRREYMKLQSLRYEVFHREFAGKKFPLGFDRDKYDSYASHLVVVEGAKKVVGTYRLIQGDKTSSFYSNSEFDLSPLNALPGSKVELSRACIHKDYRSGRVLNLLWRGIAGFAQSRSARWLVGIPSVKTSDPFAAAALYKIFENSGWVHPDFRLEPRGEYKMRGFNEALMATRDLIPETLPVSIPPLMLSYFRAGAKILGIPAYDPAFHCIDFPIALDLTAIDPRFRRKYIDIC